MPEEEKKTERRELKIVLGIMLTIIALAAIVAVVIVAVNSGQPESQLFRGKYDYVDDYMIDGTFIAARDGEYMLVKEDRIISARYTSLSHNPDYQTYRFIASDGFAGELNLNGEVLYRRKITGNEINPFNRTTKPFYYTVHTDGVSVFFGDEELKFKSGDHIYTSAEKRELERLPLGVVLYREFETGTDYLTSFFNKSLKLKLGDCTLMDSLVTVYADGTYKSYTLPGLAGVPFLDAAEPSEIFLAQGIPVRYSFKDNKNYLTFNTASGEEKYELPDVPSGVLAINGKSILVQFSAEEGNPGRVTLYSPDGAASGPYKRLASDLFFIGNTLYNDRLSKITETAGGAEQAEVLRADGIRYIYADGNLYTFDGAALVQKLNGVQYRLYKGSLYFLTKTILFTNKLEVVLSSGSMSFAGENLVKTGDYSYADFTGKTVTNVTTVFDVFDFADKQIAGEYIFRTSDGLYRNFTSVLTVKNTGVPVRVYKAKTGGYILKTEDGFAAGETVLRQEEFNVRLELFGDNCVMGVDHNRIVTYTVTAKSEISLTETGYYSNIQAEGFAGGIRFCDRNGLYGFYNRDGRLVSGPKYEGLELTANFVIATATGGRIWILDYTAKKLTEANIKTVYAEYGEYLLAGTAEGNNIFISRTGQVASGRADFYKSMAAFVTDTDDRADAEMPISYYKQDPKFTYEVFMFENGLQILKIAA